MVDQIGGEPKRHVIIGKWACITASAFFVLSGVILNSFTISWLLYGVDILPTSQKIFITALDALFIFVGYIFWRYRNSFEKQVNIAILFITILGCFLVTEGALHILSPRGVGHPATPILTENCSVSGLYCVKPNLDMTVKIGFDDAKIQTNAFGMPGKEASLENPSSQRIAFLGDSNLFGFWASSYEKSFAGIAAEALDKKSLQVLNFGVPGYGQVNQEILLKEQVMKFKPSNVVLFFTNSNDLRDNYLGQDMYDITSDGVAAINQKNYQEKMGMEVRNSVVSGQPALVKSVLMAARNSYLYTYAYSFFQHYLKTSQKSLDLDNFMAPMYWSRSSYGELAGKAKNETMEKLDEIVTFCKENNISFSLVAVPFYEQVYLKNPVTENYDISYPQKYIGEYAASHDIAYVDLLPALRQYRENNPKAVLYNEDGLHFNDAGHEIAGNIITGFLQP